MLYVTATRVCWKQLLQNREQEQRSVCKTVDFFLCVTTQICGKRPWTSWQTHTVILSPATSLDKIWGICIKTVCSCLKLVLMADINKHISILVLASKVQFWSGYIHTDLRFRYKYRFRFRLGEENLLEWHASLHHQWDDSPQSCRPGRSHSGQSLSDPSSESCISWSQ